MKIEDPRKSICSSSLTRREGQDNPRPERNWTGYSPAAKENIKGYIQRKPPLCIAEGVFIMQKPSIIKVPLLTLEMADKLKT